MLIFSPKVVIEQFLGISFNRLAVKHLAGLVGKTERTVYSWFSREKIPKRSDFYRIIDQIDTVFDGNYEGIAYPINSYELIRIFKDPDWSIFAASQLRQSDNVFRGTYVEMLRRCRHNSVGGKGGSLYQLGNYLPIEIIDYVHNLSDNKKGSDNTKETISDFLEFSALIYYLASAEAEYLNGMDCKESTLIKKLPRYLDKKKGTVNTPVEIFFKDLFSMLIEKVGYDNKNSISEKVKVIARLGEPMSALREMNRMENDATCPSWNTINEWIYGLFPSVFEGASIDIESELIHAQNVFGGTRILDKCFRKFEEVFSGQHDPVDFFQKLYPHYFNHHMTNLKKEADSKARPS